MQRAPKTPHTATQRKSLLRRIKQMYAWFADESWEKCYSLIDPRLRDEQKVERETYVDLLRAFKTRYGIIEPWHIRANLHLDGTANQRDPRPFAYVYVVWQDQSHEFHMFRERWVYDSGKWFTRVVGLVPDQASLAAAE